MDSYAADFLMEVQSSLACSASALEGKPLDVHFVEERIREVIAGSETPFFGNGWKRLKRFEITSWTVAVDVRNAVQRALTSEQFLSFFGPFCDTIFTSVVCATEACMKAKTLDSNHRAVANSTVRTSVPSTTPFSRSSAPSAGPQPHVSSTGDSQVSAPLPLGDTTDTQGVKRKRVVTGSKRIQGWGTILQGQAQNIPEFSAPLVFSDPLDKSVIDDAVRRAKTNMNVMYANFLPFAFSCLASESCVVLMCC
jgi:hypothetical protein